MELRLPAAAVAWATADAGNTIVIPAPAIAAARAQIPADKHDVLGVLLGLPHTVILALDAHAADQLGDLLAGVRGADSLVAAAHVALAAAVRGWPCLTDRARGADRNTPQCHH